MSQYDPQQQPSGPQYDPPQVPQDLRPQYYPQPGNAVQPWQQPQYAPQQYQQPYPLQQVAPRSPAAGLIVSIFLPGVGSMMAGKTGKGIAILLGYLISYALMLVVIGFILVPVFWILGMVFGYTDAVAWNRAHGIIS